MARSCHIPTLSCIGGRLHDTSYRHIPTASPPQSPDIQLEREKRAGEDNLPEEELDKYYRYIKEEVRDENVQKISKEQMTRIR